MRQKQKKSTPLMAGRRKTAQKRPPKPKQHGPLRRLIGLIVWPLLLLWRLLWRVMLFSALASALVLGALVIMTASSLPDAASQTDGRARGSVTLLDRHGRIFALHGDQFGGSVTASGISEHLKNAIIATEDKRFYRHIGISPRGIASAIRINMREGRGPLQGHGGSTITQQTAKLLCLGQIYDPAEWESAAEYEAQCRRASMQRKAREAIYSLAMEIKYTKDEILGIYMNRAYMGGGTFGVAAAAEHYFGKSAAGLNPSESAMLAGLLTAPSSLAPTANLLRSQNRAATVLRLMNEQGYLSDNDTAYWQANPASPSKTSDRRRGGYFADWVMRAGPDYYTSNTTEDVVIETTLDPAIQKAVAQAVERIFAEKVREGSKAQVAVVVMSADGAVRAMVGGRDVDASGEFNRAVQAIRQTGSAFKPFVYATALELGASPLDTVVDEPFCMSIPGSGQWCPENYSREYNGRVTLTEALKRSLNIPAIKTSERVGRDLVMQVARDFGIYRDLRDTPSLALGVSEANLLEMTGAYAGILNGGSSVTPYGLRTLRLKDGSEPFGEEIRGGMGERVIRPEAAGQLTWMMEKVVSEGTGRRARLEGRQAAGKTGTSQEARDAWFVGFTADYVAGVWMGYDDNTPLTGVTGSGLPAQIWHEVMMQVHQDLPARPLPLLAPAPSAPPPAVTPERSKRDRIAEGVLQLLLQEILGGN